MNTLSDYPGARATCARYIGALALDGSTRESLLDKATEQAGGDIETAMATLHRSLAEETHTGRPCSNEVIANPAYASIQGRLKLAYSSPNADCRPLITRDVQDRVRLVTTPPLSRSSMLPQPWSNNPFKRLYRWLSGRHRRTGEDPRTPRKKTRAPEPRISWQGAGHRRRALLLLLVLGQTCIGTYYMATILPYHGATLLGIAEMVIYALLFGWISAGFWTAIMGFFSLLVGRDRYTISASAATDAPIGSATRTALLMPICNENVSRVYAGLRATYESVQRSGQLDHFDFYILSDSNDADTRVAELDAWQRLCREVGGYDRIFYRRRQHRIKRKSGNIADWCRRWGRRYRYMLILDADSVMTGPCLTRLVQLMQANPNAGIIQTAPIAAGRDTLYARLQQFATRVYGPLFTAGLHFWQLGESHYWGHNAIIRVAPFIEHCALGRLPGRGALSGEILSHDFVEAALMRRAGWSVWIAYDLPGSYEEMPPSLLDELKRDRRWCQGNLMNFKLFLTKGLHPAHRAVFMTGVMAYLSAPIWFVFLLVSTGLLVRQTLTPPQYFIAPYQLFPLWPEWHPGWAIALFSATATLLFLPKILAALLVVAKGARQYGGSLRLLGSLLLEMLFSALLAPIRMLFHTRFVLTALAGLKVRWQSPPREDAETGWLEALSRHGLGTLLGIVWAGGVYWLNPEYLWWLAPIVGSLIISIPLSVWSSRTRWGRRLRRAKLFLLPEEVTPPRELRDLDHHLAASPREPGMIEAITDPTINALLCASSLPRSRRPEATRQQREQLVKTALASGPEAVSAEDRNILLSDPWTLSRLHFLIWTSANVHAGWGIASVAPPPTAADGTASNRPLQYCYPETHAE